MPQFSPARFRKLRTTATLEFQRLLLAGEGALLALPDQHLPTVQEVLASHALRESAGAGLTCDFAVKVEHGLWRPASAWSAPRRVAKLPLQARSALCLASLLRFIERGEYKRQPFEGRMTIRNEILVLWWDLFVIPELEARGVSRQGRRNRSRTNSHHGQVPIDTEDVRQFAADLLRRSVPREQAKSKIATKFGLSPSSVNKVLKQVGYLAARGRPLVIARTGSA